MEPWISDGRPEGTRLVRDLAPGVEGSSNQNSVEAIQKSLTVAGGMFFFVLGSTLWRSDGTEGGTQAIKELQGCLAEYWSAALGSRLVFRDCDALWITDGTRDGTQILHSGGFLGLWPLTNDRFVLEGYSQDQQGSSHFSLWVTDGSREGTQLVMDDVRFRGWPDIDFRLRLAGHRVFFWTESGLWSSDGSRDGTQRVMDDPFPSEELLFPWAGSIGDRLFQILFTCGDGHCTYSLLESDGTREGTREMDLSPAVLTYCYVGP